MLKKRISKSKKFAALKTNNARLLYLLLLPHLDIEGRIDADPRLIKGQVVPLLRFSTSKIAEYLQDMDSVGLIRLYDDNGDKYLEYGRFKDFQTLRPDREAESDVPTPVELPDNSGLSEAKRSEDKLSLSISEDKVVDSENSPSGDSVRFDSGNSQIKSIKLNDLLTQLLGVESKGDRTCYRKVSNAAFAKMQAEPESKICSEIWEIAQRCARDGQNPRAMFVSMMQEIGVLEKKER